MKVFTAVPKGLTPRGIVNLTLIEREATGHDRLNMGMARCTFPDFHSLNTFMVLHWDVHVTVMK